MKTGWDATFPGAVAKLARTSAVAVLNVLLPAECACCEMPVQVPGQLCATCFRELCFVTEPCCQRCGRPFETLGEVGRDRTCESCLASPPPWTSGRAALVYDAPARKLVLPLKYGGRTENARVLGFHMARAGARLLAEADALVPVPLHRRRLLQRRYNQAALLAWDLGRRSGVRVLPDALRRIRHTATLLELSAARREEELQGAIVVRARRREALRGGRLLLIDDVLTTGATAAACARALLDAGAAQVDLLVASRVAPRRD